jgi:hypothetical protein
MKPSFENYSPKIEAEPQKSYEFFDDRKERLEVFNYSKKIAEYLRSKKVPNLVIIDRSSRPLYVGVREYLQTKYPDEKMPNIYFMNPKGFKAKEDLSPDEIREIVDDCEWKEDLVESPQKVRSQADIMQEFKDVYKKLMEDKERPVLVFDTCIHSGGSLSPVKKIMGEAGFSNIIIGSVNPSDKEAKIQSDFFITTKRPEKGCYPFDRDRIIEKTFNHIYSKRTNDPEKRKKSLRLRKEIKEIMTDFLSREND